MKILNHWIGLGLFVFILLGVMPLSLKTCEALKQMSVGLSKPEQVADKIRLEALEEYLRDHDAYPSTDGEFYAYWVKVSGYYDCENVHFPGESTLKMSLKGAFVTNAMMPISGNSLR